MTHSAQYVNNSYSSINTIIGARTDYCSVGDCEVYAAFWPSVKPAVFPES